MQATIVFEKIWQAINAKNEDGSRKYRYIINTGSSRSSKTYSILQSHYLTAFSKSNYRISIWRETKQDVKNTVLSDFKKALPSFPKKDLLIFNKTESIYYFPNKSTIEICGGDDENRVHGFQGDVAHFNEPYKMPKDVFDQIDMRTSDYIIIDWNPRQSHWIDILSKQDNAIVIHSTFRDNPFVPEQQRLKILSYDPNNERNVINQTADEYMWQVYGLGMKAEKPNRIYRNWGKITPDEYEALPYKEYFYNDWGKNDPWAIGRFKYHDGSFYVKEVNYKSENQIEKDIPVNLQREFRESDVEDKENERNEGLAIVSWYYSKLGIPKDAVVVCDSAKPLKITMLRRSGWLHAEPALKGAGSVDTGIDLVKSVKVYYTTDSPNIENEYENYSYVIDRYNHVTDEPEDKDNHHMDGIRYGCSYLVRIGVLRLS